MKVHKKHFLDMSCAGGNKRKCLWKKKKNYPCHYLENSQILQHFNKLSRYRRSSVKFCIPPLTWKAPWRFKVLSNLSRSGDRNAEGCQWAMSDFTTWPSTPPHFFFFFFFCSCSFGCKFKPVRRVCFGKRCWVTMENGFGFQGLEKHAGKITNENQNHLICQTHLEENVSNKMVAKHSDSSWRIGLNQWGTRGQD